MKIYLVDNFDSFTYNLVQALSVHAEVRVHRNQYWHDADLAWADGIVISPGPGLPGTSGFLMRIVETYYGKKPILGICLGMQALGLHKGGELINLPKVRHGLQRRVEVVEPGCLLNEILKPFEVGLYHSWALKRVPSNFTLLAQDGAGIPMAMEDPENKAFALQFHPESVMTSLGPRIIQNFLDQVRGV